MSKEFEFTIIGDEGSFLSLLETNNILYTVLPKRTPSLATRPSRMKLVTSNVKRRTLSVNVIAIQLMITLTPLALEKIWNWYKGKRKGSRLSVKVEGNLLELDTKTVKALRGLLKEISEGKKRRKSYSRTKRTD